MPEASTMATFTNLFTEDGNLGQFYTCVRMYEDELDAVLVTTCSPWDSTVDWGLDDKRRFEL